MTTLTFTVRGIPGAQGSKVQIRPGVMVESSKKVKPWRSDVKAAAEAEMDRVMRGEAWTPYSGPVWLSVRFRFARPKSHYRTGRKSHLLRDDTPIFCTSRKWGDADKLLRSTGDALTAAGVWADDVLAALIEVHKVYCHPDETPGADIVVSPMAAVSWEQVRGPDDLD